MTLAPPGFAEWAALGTELAKRPHRLALALRVACAAAGGGAELTSHEEDELCSWFRGVVDLAIEHTGGARPDKGGPDLGTPARVAAGAAQRRITLDSSR